MKQYLILGTVSWIAGGNKYPTKSLYQILYGILHYVRKNDSLLPIFLDQNDSCFHDLKGMCESLFRDLCQKGVGANPKKMLRKRRVCCWGTAVLGCSNT